jgi:hypothetical protein
MPAWLPEKFRVMGADGKLDLDASSQKLAQSYAAAQSRIGSGDIPPATAADYKTNLPEQFKDVQMDEALSTAFRDRAHKAGLTQSQFDFVMGEYFELVPSVLDGAAKHTAAAAREKLQEVWRDPGQYEAEMKRGQTAFNKLPEQLRAEIMVSGMGANPMVAQMLAHFGREYREDSPPSHGAPNAATGSAEELMKHPAYRDPKHPEHAAISAKVQDAFRRTHGDSPVAG